MRIPRKSWMSQSNLNFSSLQIVLCTIGIAWSLYVGAIFVPVYPILAQRVDDGELTWRFIAWKLLWDRRPNITEVPVRDEHFSLADFRQLKKQGFAPPVFLSRNPNFVGSDWMRYFDSQCGNKSIQFVSFPVEETFSNMPSMMAFLVDWALFLSGVANDHKELMKQQSASILVRDMMARQAHEAKLPASSWWYIWFVKPWLYRPLGFLYEKIAVGPHYFHDIPVSDYCPQFTIEPGRSHVFPRSRIPFEIVPYGPFIGGDKSNAYPPHIDYTMFAKRSNVWLGITGKKHWWVIDPSSIPFLTPWYIGETTLFGAVFLGEGIGTPPFRWLQPANYLHNMLQAFFFPLATGWHATVGEGDVMVVPPRYPHFVVNEGFTFHMRYAWVPRQLNQVQ